MTPLQWPSAPRVATLPPASPYRQPGGHTRWHTSHTRWMEGPAGPRSQGGLSGGVVAGWLRWRGLELHGGFGGERANGHVPRRGDAQNSRAARASAGSSRSRRNCFRFRPPVYPVNDPFFPSTRWHGTTIDNGFCPTAFPTACAVSPRRAAISPYDVVSPYGISLRIDHTRRWNSSPRSTVGRSKLVRSPSRYSSS